MSTLFTLNFRRQAYLAEVARGRRRIVAIGVWVAYFGVLVVLLGLYGLNCASLARRVHQIDRQAARLREARAAGVQWTVSDAEIIEVERYVSNPRGWRNRLVHLATVLPPNARLTSLVVNPQNLSNPADENKLVITGVLHSSDGSSEMQGIMSVVSRLRADSVFAADYRNIKLTSTQAAEGAGSAQFVIECR